MRRVPPRSERSIKLNKEQSKEIIQVSNKNLLTKINPLKYCMTSSHYNFDGLDNEDK